MGKNGHEKAPNFTFKRTLRVLLRETAVIKRTTFFPHLAKKMTHVIRTKKAQKYKFNYKF
jgi:hypothetical protein